MLRWSHLLCEKRFSDLYGHGRSKPDVQESPAFEAEEFRLPQERDHDRILFSTPFRRMGDKTQVFPLESIESIRTRLTHSYEVANLSRSLGTQIAVSFEKKLPKNALRVVPAMLAAVGLAHDIGNPPFGHQGEHAIRSWFERNRKKLFEPTDACPDIAEDVVGLTSQHEKDFLLFEGNAQTLRVVTKLQVIGNDLGLNLTLGTLAALMKYVSPSDRTDENRQARSKVGFFASEQPLVEQIRHQTGLKDDVRHPLTLVMDACDDIAYSVLDAEGAVKKKLVSLNDLLAALEHSLDEDGKTDRVIQDLCSFLHGEFESLRKQKLHPDELQDVATQKFRVRAIRLMVFAVAEAFEKNYGSFSVCVGSGRITHFATSPQGGAGRYRQTAEFACGRADDHDRIPLRIHR